MFIDTHCHIFNEYYNNIDELIEDCKINGISKIIVNGCDIKSNMEVIKLISKYNIGSYTIRYIERLKPIILAQLPDGLSLDGESDVTDCKLDELLHDSILKRAVELAISTRGHVNK